MKKFSILITCIVISSLVTAVPCNMRVNLAYKLAICYGEFADTVSAVVINGTGPFTYAWSNGGLDSVGILTSGPFSVTVTDANSCIAADSGYVLSDPELYYVNRYNLYLCSEPAYADFIAAGRGGTLPYSYAVSGAGYDSTNTTGHFSFLPPGNYSFVVSDSLGCYVEDIFTVPQGAANDSFTITTDSISCRGAIDGKIIITPLNPADGPYTYSVDSSASQTDSILSNLAAGIHNLTARSVTFDCVYDMAAAVPNSQSVCTGIAVVRDEGSIGIFPNPALDELHIHSASGNIQQVTISNLLGEIVLSNTKINAAETNLDITVLTSGAYLVNISGEGFKSVKKVVKE